MATKIAMRGTRGTSHHEMCRTMAARLVWAVGLAAGLAFGWIEAAANYVRFHARGKAFLLRTTMAQLEQELDPRRFARIHRSTIVNLDRVREIRPEWHGDYDVLLTTGDTLRLGRRYRQVLLR